MIESTPDLDYMLRDSGVLVELGHLSTYGIVNTTDEDLFRIDAGSLAGTVTIIDLRTGSLDGLAEGARVKFNGITYRVVKLRKVNDGLETRVYCAPV